MRIGACEAPYNLPPQPPFGQGSQKDEQLTNSPNRFNARYPKPAFGLLAIS